MDGFAYIDFEWYKNNVISYDAKQVAKQNRGFTLTGCDEVESFVRHELIACLMFSNRLDDYTRNELENLINYITRDDNNNI